MTPKDIFSEMFQLHNLVFEMTAQLSAELAMLLKVPIDAPRLGLLGALFPISKLAAVAKLC